MNDLKLWLNASTWTLEEACTICHGGLPPREDNFKNFVDYKGRGHSWRFRTKDADVMASYQIMFSLARRALALRGRTDVFLYGVENDVKPADFVAWAVRMDCFGLPDYILEHFGHSESKDTLSVESVIQENEGGQEQQQAAIASSKEIVPWFDDQDKYIFRYVGDAYEIIFKGRVVSRSLKTKGFKLLYILVCNPGKEYNAISLAAAEEEQLFESNNTNYKIYDDKSLNEFKEKLESLESEILEAERNNDSAKASGLRCEKRNLSYIFTRR